MKLYWKNFTEEDYKDIINNFSTEGQTYGQVRVGLLCFDLASYYGDDEKLWLQLDCFIGGEEGYDRKENGYPYNMLDEAIVININEFKETYNKMKLFIEDRIKEFIHQYNLEQYSNRRLFLW